jgi:hypothetical protein
VAASGTSTRSLVPSKLRARPNLPVVTRVAPLTVPLVFAAEESVAVVPAVSSKP